MLITVTFNFNDRVLGALSSQYPGEPMGEAVRKALERAFTPKEKVVRTKMPDGYVPAVERAEAYLKLELWPGPMTARAIYEGGALEGLSPATLKRAKAALNVRCFKTGFGKQSEWHWELPGGPEK